MTARLAVGIGVTLLIVRRVFVLVAVAGDSMAPTYGDGDLLLGVRTRAGRVGRAVVFRPPYAVEDGSGPALRVKRLAAVAGDAVPPWVRGAIPGSTVPAGRIVVRGDNERSEDSRNYGYLLEDSVVAVVVGRVRAARALPAEVGAGGHAGFAPERRDERAGSVVADAPGDVADRLARREQR